MSDFENARRSRYWQQDLGRAGDGAERVNLRRVAARRNIDPG
jgi:hypothetical protein